MKHDRRGKLYICKITNKIFNNDFNHIGNAINVNKNQYNLNFLDEI
jgi:hypothetical protein